MTVFAVLLDCNGSVVKYKINPNPKPNVGDVNAVKMAVPQPTTKSIPFNSINDLGITTLLRTALTITELRAAFGVGLMMLMYGMAMIQINAVKMHAS